MTTDSLQRLARDRSLLTLELHPPNAFYGHAAVLKRYVGLSQHRPLKAVIEHGIRVGSGIGEADLASQLPVFLCASQDRASTFDALAAPRKRAVPIGPILSYLPSDPELDETPVRRLLIVPAHSSHYVTASFDVARFVQQALEADDTWDDVEVCLYWKDVLRGAASEYERHGLRCVTAGHLYDRRFLIRFRRILQRASAVVTNDVGTHLCYSILEGKPVWYVDQVPSWVADSATILERDVASDERAKEVAATARQLFSEPQSKPTEQQQEFVRQLAGTDHIRSPPELREILKEAESQYQQRYASYMRVLQLARRAASNSSIVLASIHRSVRLIRPTRSWK